MPPRHKKCTKSKKEGSQDTNSPPKVPTALTTQTHQSGLILYMKDLALSVNTIVSCKKIIFEEVLLINLQKEASLRGSPTPLILEESRIMV
jgi:hypothetical protein